MKYVAWRAANGDCMGWTTKTNFDNVAMFRDGAVFEDEGETLVEFDAPEYDGTDEMFADLKVRAREACLVTPTK